MKIYTRFSQNLRASHTGGDYDHWLEPVVIQGEIRFIYLNSSEFPTCPVCGQMDTTPFPPDDMADTWGIPDRCNACQEHDSAPSDWGEIAERHGWACVCPIREEELPQYDDWGRRKKVDGELTITID